VKEFSDCFIKTGKGGMSQAA